jgi:MFS family permease
MMLIIFVQFYIVTTFTLAYATAQLGVSRNVLLAGLLLAGAADFAGILIFARVADRIGKRRVAIWSGVSMVLLAFPYFSLIGTGVATFICVGMMVGLFVEGALYGITGVLLAELFPARLRYSGISFSYQLAGVLGGAPAPIIATSVIQWAGGAAWPVATYVTVNALISLVAICLASERYRADIHDQRSAEHRLASNWGEDEDQPASNVTPKSGSGASSRNKDRLTATATILSGGPIKNEHSVGLRPWTFYRGTGTANISSAPASPIYRKIFAHGGRRAGHACAGYRLWRGRCRALSQRYRWTRWSRGWP